MDSSRLSAEQIARLRSQLERQRDYLHHLCMRMADQNWRVDDPMLQAATDAYHAVDRLTRLAVVRRRPGGRLP